MNKNTKIENIRQMAYGAKQVADFMNLRINMGDEVSADEYTRFFYWANEFIRNEVLELNDMMRAEAMDAVAAVAREMDEETAE